MKKAGLLLRSHWKRIPSGSRRAGGERRTVWKAMMAGFLATCLTASIVGLLPQGLFG